MNGEPARLPQPSYLNGDDFALGITREDDDEPEIERGPLDYQCKRCQRWEISGVASVGSLLGLCDKCVENGWGVDAVRDLLSELRQWRELHAQPSATLAGKLPAIDVSIEEAA